MVRAWHGRGMASVNQTRPHCVNQMGKTHSKPLAARHGHCMLCVNRPLQRYIRRKTLKRRPYKYFTCRSEIPLIHLRPTDYPNVYGVFCNRLQYQELGAFCVRFELVRELCVSSGYGLPECDAVMFVRVLPTALLPSG